MKKLRSLIYGLINACEASNTNPDEGVIDFYLNAHNVVKERETIRTYIIKFCFYHWEKRNDEEFVENLLNLATN